MSSEENPARHILAVTIGYAIREGAHKIRFVVVPANERRKHLFVSVLYGDDEEQWQEKMKLPAFVREALFEELRLFSQATESHGFELEMPYFGVKTCWHLTFDFTPDETGQESALIIFGQSSSASFGNGEMLTGTIGPLGES